MAQYFVYFSANMDAIHRLEIIEKLNDKSCLSENGDVSYGMEDILAVVLASDSECDELSDGKSEYKDG